MKERHNKGGVSGETGICHLGPVQNNWCGDAGKSEAAQRGGGASWGGVSWYPPPPTLSGGR